MSSVITWCINEYKLLAWLVHFSRKIIHCHHYHITCQQLSSGTLNVLVCLCTVLLAWSVSFVLGLQKTENTLYSCLPGRYMPTVHMSNHGLGACGGGGGGWTLVMKIDGHKVSLVGKPLINYQFKAAQHIPQGTKINNLKILKKKNCLLSLKNK